MSTSVISARESDVLALLGEHLSNAEIAARLFISVRTVESHVSSLLRKLEVPDRRALARRAPEPTRAGQARPEALLPEAVSPAAVSPARALPAPLTAFVGRTRERGELAGAVTARRLVTAVGLGGVGKTRLALAVAAQVAGDFADGVCFVDLVPVTDPGRVGAAVAEAMGVGEQPGRGIDDTLVAALADRQALLVLDNCEQVRDGVAPFLERLLVACPGMRVLATSRARLMVPFEWVFPVPPLSRAGGGGSEAVALFLERAAAVGRAEHDRIAALCERLDGMALAIELAAARWSTLGLDGLTAGLSDQLRILAGGPGPTAGTGRCGPSSTGATTCSTHRTGHCCGGCRRSSPCSPPRRPPRWPGPPAGGGGGRRRAREARRAEPARRDAVRDRHPLPGAGDPSPVRHGTARRRR
ncbi:ATP-binding protein [Kitasatospora aburaviensis]